MIKFLFPFDGCVLNYFDGEIKDNKLLIKVKIISNSKKVLINNVLANNIGNSFVCEIALKEGKSKIEVKTENDIKLINVLWINTSQKYYRFSIDDCILFLKDLNDNYTKYNSIFDNSFLAMLKRVHDSFDSKFHLNLFYDTSSLKGFSKDIDYFDLSMMNGKFKDEFNRNSSWLNFSFHSRSEYPESPYKLDNSLLEDDIKKINESIIRFASKECLAKETTIHYGELNEDSIKICKKCGYNIFSGFFTLENNKRIVSYYLSIETIKNLVDRDFYFDFNRDVLFSKIDRVLNYDNDVNINLNIIKEKIKNNHQFLDIMIHEQYFYKDYFHYMDKFENILFNVAFYLKNNNYTSIFISDYLRRS